MKTWEDIVKDKLEEPGETLPESVFAEFHERLDAAAAPSRKRIPMVWALVPAVAAGLAVVLFLRQAATPEDGILIVPQPADPIAAVIDSTDAVDLIQEPLLIVQAVTPNVIRHPAVSKQETEMKTILPEDIASAETTDISTAGTKERKTADEDISTVSSPFIPQNTSEKPMRMKIAPAAGTVAGGGLLAAMVVPGLHAGTTTRTGPINQGDPLHDGIFIEPENPIDEPTGSPVHYFPFKGGLSIGIPVSDSWKVTTGLEYSLYQSSFTYTLSGEKKQSVHYLGIPVRLDWTLANNRWLDVYLGGGVEGDYCIGATLAGESIKRDGFSFSLLGTGGIQFNFTKHIGLYVEPKLSWTIPSKSPVLKTYRSEHPMMFSMASGLRINIGK